MRAKGQMTTREQRAWRRRIVLLLVALLILLALLAVLVALIHSDPRS